MRLTKSAAIEKNEEDIYEVELTALEGNEFAVMTQSDIRLTGIRASCKEGSQKERKRDAEPVRQSGKDSAM